MSRLALRRLAAATFLALTILGMGAGFGKGFSAVPEPEGTAITA